MWGYARFDEAYLNESESFRERWKKMEKALRHADNLPLFLGLCSSDLRDLRDKPYDELSWVAKHSLGHCVDSLLARSDLLTKKAEANTLIQAIMQFAIESIDTLHITIVSEIIQTCFTPKARYYEKSHKDDVPQEIKKQMKDEAEQAPWAKKTLSKDFSLWFPHNLNYFGSLKGFDHLLAVLQRKDLNIIEIRVTVKIVWTIREYLSHDFLNTYVPMMKEHLWPTLLKIREGNLDANGVALFGQTSTYMQNMMTGTEFLEKRKKLKKTRKLANF